MKAGVIGKANGEIKDFSDFTDIRHYDNKELRRRYELDSPRDTSSGITFYPGRAAVERMEDTRQINFNENGIIVTETEEKKQFYAEFLLVPEGFVITENSSGEFVFDLLESQTGLEIDRANIDLYELLEHCSNNDPDPWQVGFYDNDGNAKKGVVYGSDVLEDSDVGRTLKNTKKNQVGLEIQTDQDVNMKFTATESGYAEVYLPDNYDSAEFIEFISNYISPNIS